MQGGAPVVSSGQHALFICCGISEGGREGGRELSVRLIREGFEVLKCAMLIFREG